MKNSVCMRAEGFGLLEAMIAMVLAAIALLGLAAAQAKALQFASSSLYSTVAVIQGQNVVERIWPKLCFLQQDVTQYNEAFLAGLRPQAEHDPQMFQLQLPDPATFHFTDVPTVHLATVEYQITISWQDHRQQDAQANKLELVASFPWLRNGGACS